MRSLLFTVLMAFAAAAAAEKAEIFADRAGAIRGYDPVTYFTQNTSVKGSESFYLP